MQAAFGAAIDALFRDANLARDALWRAGGVDGAIPVRVVWRAPDAIAEFGGGRFVAAARLLDVRTKDIPAPKQGDTFEIDGAEYLVQAEPRRDDYGLIWSIELTPL
jgi:hypothetical protein